MNHKIACPHCQHSLSIKEPKPGRYKPKCSGCNSPFIIVVEAGEPLRITVTTVAPKVSGFDETVEPHESSEATRPANVTLPPPSPSNISGSNKPSGFEQTLDQSGGKGTSREFSVNQQTMESAPSQSLSSASKSATSRPESADAAAPINRLGGYRILKELGAGGMGSVYLAKQISLDRSCAVKTIQAKWAQNPRVIARFIREAYAAAQLTHHNVVQIYDLGVDGNTNFFSMELVSGGSLDDQLKNKGKLQPKLASMLILQASRGLKFAHDHGMVHRDIKPANLMMTSDGMVKVADMGLVKTLDADESQDSHETDVQSMVLASARSQVTAIGSSMGTPAYMSPEQSTDAANVDKRADIYSLGCTFYALLTGKPPFEGSTMMEVITKHRVEKIVRPERIIAGLPTVLGDVIEKMTAKSPNDRYQDLEELIHDLEVYLELREDTSKASVQHHPGDVDEVERAAEKAKSVADASVSRSANLASILSPEQVGVLQVATKRFNGSPLLMVRRFAPMAWFGLCGLMCVMSLLFSIMAGLSLIGEGAKSVAAQANNAVQGIGGVEATAAVAAPAPVSKGAQAFASMVSQFRTALGYALALCVAPLAAIVFAGLERRSPLAQRWRASFIAGGIAEWIYWMFGGLVALLATHYLGLWFPVIVGTIFGVLAGAAYYFGLEKTLSKARQPSIDQTQTLLKQLRLRGTDEDNVRQAVADNAGAKWEEFYETLFGYAAMRAMRTRLQQSKRSGLQVFRPRRDKLIDQWEQKVVDSRSQRDQKILGKAEKAELVANGVSESEAAKRANAMAASMVDAAQETRQTIQDIASGKLTDQAASAKRQRIKQMMSEAKSGKLSERTVRSRGIGILLSQWFGSKFRFVCGSVLLLATGMWLQSNQIEVERYWQQARTTAQSTLDSLKNTTLDAKGLENAKQALTSATEQAKTAIVKAENVAWKSAWGGLITEKNVVSVALAGLLLLGSLYYSGWKVSFAVAPVAILICAIPWFM